MWLNGWLVAKCGRRKRSWDEIPFFPMIPLYSFKGNKSRKIQEVKKIKTQFLTFEERRCVQLEINNFFNGYYSFLLPEVRRRRNKTFPPKNWTLFTRKWIQIALIYHKIANSQPCNGFLQKTKMVLVRSAGYRWIFVYIRRSM